MKYLVLLLLMFALTFSCSKPCDDVNCGEFGLCSDGNCNCQEGVYGDECDLFYRDDFLGSWQTIAHSCDVGNSLPSVYTFSKRDKIDEVEITTSITPAISIIGKASEKFILIEPQTIFLGVAVVHSGSATLDSTNNMILTIVQEAEGQPKRTCTYTLKK